MGRPFGVSIAAAIASLLLLLVVFELIRSRRLRERYALLWLLTGVVLLVLWLWRGGLNTIAGWAGISGYPPAVLFAVGLALHPARAAPLLDGDLAALRPEHDPRAASRAAGENDSARSGISTAATEHERVDHAVGGRREHVADLVAVDPVSDERRPRAALRARAVPSAVARAARATIASGTRTSHSVGSKRCSATAARRAANALDARQVELGTARHVVHPAPRQPRHRSQEREREPEETAREERSDDHERRDLDEAPRS